MDYGILNDGPVFNTNRIFLYHGEEELESPLMLNVNIGLACGFHSLLGILFLHVSLTRCMQEPNCLEIKRKHHIFICWPVVTSTTCLTVLTMLWLKHL